MRVPLGIPVSQYSRIERGLSADLSIDMAVRLFAVLGMDLAIRAYPTGDPIRGVMAGVGAASPIHASRKLPCSTAMRHAS